MVVIFIIIIIIIIIIILATLHGMWDLTSPTRVEPAPPAVEAQSLNYWTTREVLFIIFYMQRFSFPKTQARHVYHRSFPPRKVISGFHLLLGLQGCSH